MILLLFGLNRMDIDLILWHVILKILVKTFHQSNHIHLINK